MIFRNPQRGFTLLISIILSSVVLALGLALLDIAYKQIVLATTAKQSQYAFYNADSALECALYWDQKMNAFDYTSPATSITCNNQTMVLTTAPNTSVTTATSRRTTLYVPCVPTGTNAVITVDKTSTGTTTLYAVGYNSCSGSDTRRVERGLTAYYAGGTTTGLVPGATGTLTYLIVAGGGSGGGMNNGGASAGGGGGGVLTGNAAASGGSYSVVVGAGGAASTAAANGGNSSALGFTAVGGGAGGVNSSSPGNVDGQNGGSGGGGIPLGRAGGLGTSGQGYSGSAGNASTYYAGGGGGAGGAGGTAASGGGAGGPGYTSTITGASQTYAGGGGGGARGTGGAGGSGGGGAGRSAAIDGDGNGGNATYYGGGGGGASEYGSSAINGGSGYQGIVIISYPTGSVDATGGTITTSGGNTIHTFTSNGTFVVSGGAITPPPSGNLSYMVVAGGGAGGGSSNGGGEGGGGAGGVLAGTMSSISAGSYAVTIGAGGTSPVGGPPAPGGNSSALGFTAIGGGRGGYGNGNAPGNGGSGGGKDYTAGSAGTGTSGQGYSGGTSGLGSPYPGAGGGGAGGVGGNASGSVAGSGGPGFTSTISGASQTYAGGGGGGVRGGGTAGAGGAGGGGAGCAAADCYGGDATYYGGGGGGGAQSGPPSKGGSGYQGIVIISYPTGLITATGGTVTTVGGNTIHTFTSSGTFQVTTGVSGGATATYAANVNFLRTPTVFTQNGVNTARSSLAVSQLTVADEYSSSYGGFKAVDGAVGDSNRWTTSNAAGANYCDMWIRTNGTTNISKIIVQNGTYPGYMPTVINVQYWNGTAWTTHFTANTANTTVEQTFTTTNTQYAEYWRFVSTGALHNGGGSNCTIEELQAFP